MRHRLQKDHFAACNRISGFSPAPRELKFGDLIRKFYQRIPNLKSDGVKRIKISDL